MSRRDREPSDAGVPRKVETYRSIQDRFPDFDWHAHSDGERVRWVDFENYPERPGGGHPPLEELLAAPERVAPDPLPDRATAMARIEPVQARLIERGVGWYKEGAFEASRVGLRSRRIPRAARERWERALMPLVWRVVNEVAPALLEESAWARSVLDVDLADLEYLRGFRAPGRAHDAPVFEYVGVDALRADGVVVDINNRPGVVGYHDAIASAYRCAGSRPGEAAPAPGFDAALFARLARDGARIAVILPERGYRFGDKRVIHDAARRHAGDVPAWRLSELADLPARETPDVAFLTMSPTSVLEDRGKFAGLRAIARRGARVVNAPESFLCASKTMMHLVAWSPRVRDLVLARLGDDPAQARERYALLRRLVVPSVLVHDGVAYLPEGEEDAHDYLTALDRGQCVLKRGCSSGGWDVHHGGYLSNRKWRALAAEVARAGTWVLEYAQDHEREPVWGVVSARGEGDDVREAEEIALERLRARILYRSYAVLGAPRVCQEVFAARSWKVNAAGWAFPAEYDGPA